ncbi:MAG: single-stranded DNA-binding protein [Clostridia bacterium]|nr:single-stranded DNA-binding protein [Clostridia bacterium]
MNKVFLIGNLTRDPELTETNSGVSVCRFAIAVNRNYSGADGERKTDFFNIVAWRGLGETIARYAKKGNKVAVSGSIELRNYEDSQGVKRTSIDIVAQDVEFLTPRQSDEFDDDVPRGQTRRQPNDYVAPPTQQSMFNKKPQLQAFDDDDDIPF